MYKTLGDRGYVFTCIFSDPYLADLKIRQPVSFDLTMRTCKNVLNFLKDVPKVCVDEAFIYLYYRTAFHTYTCMIKQVNGAITLLRDGEVAVADKDFSALTRGILATWLSVAREDAIIEIPDDSHEEPISQKTSVFTAQAAPTPTPTSPKRRKVKIAITYTREVGIDDSTFSSVMDQIDRLCKAQPHSLNNGFTMSDTSIAIADD